MQNILPTKASFLKQMTNIIKDLRVYPKKMKKNLEQYGYLHISQKLMLNLINKGLSRKKAYEIVQSASIEASNSNKQFKKVLNNNKELKEHINSVELKKN